MTNKKRIVLLIIISILIIMTLTLGITYAFVKPIEENSPSDNSVSISACAKIQLKGNDKTTINLENTYPMDDELGLKTKPYEFIITSTCENYVGFNLYLTSLTDNEIEDNAIHFAITDTENSILATNVLDIDKTTNGLSDFNSNELSELGNGIKGTPKNIYKVYSENISLKGTSNYRLYLWVDKDASNETTGSFKVGLSIKSYNRKKTIADACLDETAECLAQNSNLDSTLYYHDGNADYDGMENYELETGDESYRFSGSDTDVKNYVCLDSKTTGTCESDDDLYRIIGLFKNEDEENEDYGKYEMKLIKAQGATTTQLGDGEAKISEEDPTPSAYNSGTNYYWNKSNGSGNVNMWRESNLNKVNLNSYFYNYITTRATYLKGHITEHTWTTGGMATTGNAKATYDAEIGEGKVKVGDNVCYTQGNTSTTRECKEEDLEYPAHIGLMYISDYMYGARPASWTTAASSYENVTSYNWLYSGSYEWSISRNSIDGFYARYVNDTGNANFYDSVDAYTNGVRPVFYLTSDVKIKEGEGSKGTPYRLEVE